VGSFNSYKDNARSVSELLQIMGSEAPDMFMKIPGASRPADGGLESAESPPESIDAGIGRAKGGGSFELGSLWLAIGLDVLGAAAIGAGVWLNGEAENYHKNYMALGPNSDFNGAQKEVESAATKRNMAYVIGGALLAAGIGVHIWF
jgi:hypothetical protein